MDSKALAARARAGFEAYRREGADGLLPYLAPDVVWEDDPEWPDSQVARGHDEVRATLRARLESTSIRPELEDVLVRGNRALLLMVWTAEGQGSGAVAVLRPAAIYDFEGDSVARIRFFLDRERARAELEGEPR